MTAGRLASITARKKPSSRLTATSQRSSAVNASFGLASNLAQTNIFPGDLLLKNFGVTRHGRVIFYDYDEVSLVTDCNFRDMPEPRDDDEMLRADSWFYVAENDMFPEEFVKFLAMDADLRDLFMEVHGDLLTAEYWRRIKNAHLAGEIQMVVPYLRPEIPLQRKQTQLSA